MSLYLRSPLELGTLAQSLPPRPQVKHSLAEDVSRSRDCPKTQGEHRERTKNDNSKSEEYVLEERGDEKGSSFRCPSAPYGPYPKRKTRKGKKTLGPLRSPRSPQPLPPPPHCSVRLSHLLTRPTTPCPDLVMIYPADPPLCPLRALEERKGLLLPPPSHPTPGPPSDPSPSCATDETTCGSTQTKETMTKVLPPPEPLSPGALPGPGERPVRDVSIGSDVFAVESSGACSSLRTHFRSRPGCNSGPEL